MDEQSTSEGYLVPGVRAAIDLLRGRAFQTIAYEKEQNIYPSAGKPLSLLDAALFLEEKLNELKGEHL